MHTWDLSVFVKFLSHAAPKIIRQQHPLPAHFFDSRYLIQDCDRRMIQNDPSCFRKEGDNDKDDMNFGPKPEALQITTQVAYYAAAKLTF